MRGELTSTRVVQLYLNRIRAYNGTCVSQPDGVLGAGPITPIKNAHQLNALMTLNLRPAKRQTLGFDPRKARSMTDRGGQRSGDARCAGSGGAAGRLLCSHRQAHRRRCTAWCLPSRISTTPSICARPRAWMPLMRTIVRRATPPSSSASETRVRSSWPRRTSAKWGRRTRAVPSAGPSVILTIRNAVPAPPAAAPDHRWPQTW